MVEVRTPPPLGTDVRLNFWGTRGSVDAPEDFELRGTVQHALLWRLGPDRKRFRGVLVRWARRYIQPETYHLH